MKQIAIIITTLVVTIFTGNAQDQKQIVDLRGNWKFEIGDNKKYADPKFDDGKWGEIFVPADWENEGYPGYDGYAWYRKKFTIPASVQGKTLYFHAGYVDDACGVYVNGNLIGEGGQFPPEFETAYDRKEIFLIPQKFLKFNQENVVAIRVYDDRLNGGIVRGKVGLFEHQDEFKFVVRFPEMWKFKKGDSKEWLDPALDDSKWQELIVPAQWDFQGYRDYDGFGWYRVTFDVPSNLQNEKLVLMLGKIDDIDEAFLNGEKIGNTGRIRSDGTVRNVREEYLETRAYTIPASTIKFGQKNVLAVRVYDNYKIGGIYEGPIGIITEKEYRTWDVESGNHYRKEINKFQRFLEKIFNE